MIVRKEDESVDTRIRQVIYIKQNPGKSKGPKDESAIALLKIICR